MRKFLLALMMTVVVASLQAITIQWTVPSSDKVNTKDGWEDWTGKLSGQSIYFVYSESESAYTDAADVWAANGDYKIVMGNDGNATYTKNGQSVADMPATYGAITPVTGSTQLDVWLAINNRNGLGDGYYYLVVFDPTVGQGGDPKYAVSNAIQYTGNAVEDKRNGITQTTVKPGDAPVVGDFVDIGWMGGTWTDVTVPEPTALALLALGVAGLALRRKI